MTGSLFPIINEAEDLRKKGHHVRVRKKFKDEIEASTELRVIDDTEIDITQRGITVSMSTEEKIDRAIEIKEIPEEKRDKYKDIGIQLTQGVCEFD